MRSLIIAILAQLLALSGCINPATSVRYKRPLQTIAATTVDPVVAKCGPRGTAPANVDCAQWKSADAAIDAARWAKWSSIVSIIGLIIVACTLRETRRSIELAERTSKAQLRAYIAISKVELRQPINPVGPARVDVIYRNYGQTPAVDTYTQVQALAIPATMSVSQVKPLRRWRDGSVGLLAPNVDEVNYDEVGELIKGSHTTTKTYDKILDDVKNGRSIIVCHGWTIYRDVFGDAYYTNFKWYWDQERMLADGSFAIANDGNDAGSCRDCLTGKAHHHNAP